MQYLIATKCQGSGVSWETSQNLNKRFNWHNFCFGNPNSYSLCKILDSKGYWQKLFSKDYCKESSYTVNIIGKLEGTGLTDRNSMDFAAKPVRKTGEIYWMHELWTVFLFDLNDRIGDEFKAANKHINVAAKFSPFSYWGTSQSSSPSTTIFE